MHSEEPETTKKSESGSPEPFRTTNRLRELRIARGWTQAELAKKIGCSTSKVMMTEIGERGLSELFCISAARVFKVSVDYLLAQTDDPARREPSKNPTSEVDRERIEQHWRNVGLPGE